MSRSRSYAFTLNNYTGDHYTFITAYLQKAKYGIVGREVGEMGTRHLQGYVYFQNAKSFNAIKKELPQGTHIEKAKGNAEQNRTYCSKDGAYFECGICPTSNKAKGAAEKERWAEARKAAVEGRLDDVPDDIFVRYYRTLKSIAEDHQQKPLNMETVTGYWYWGKPQSGKSFAARSTFPDAYIKNQNKWWDGYAGEKAVIIDDFDSAQLGHFLKIWADRYAFRAEVKGGTQFIRPEAIVITSNYSIQQIAWPDNQMMEAVNRRFLSKEFTGHWEVPERHFPEEQQN